MSYFEDFIADYVADEDMIYKQIEEKAKKGYWKTKDGTVLHVSEMSDDHIKNCINYIKRHDKKDYFLPWIDMFEKELIRRNF